MKTFMLLLRFLCNIKKNLMLIL